MFQFVLHLLQKYKVWNVKIERIKYDTTYDETSNFSTKYCLLDVFYLCFSFYADCFVQMSRTVIKVCSNEKNLQKKAFCFLFAYYFCLFALNCLILFFAEFLFKNLKKNWVKFKHSKWKPQKLLFRYKCFWIDHN